MARDRPPGIPRQKTGFADDQRRADVAAARRQRQDTLPVHDARSFVVLDESGVTTDLLRRYAPSPRGLRLRDDTPCGHRQTRTVVAALRVDGLHAPAVFEGPLDNPTFLASVEQNLVRPGEVVVLDHLAMHQPPEGQAAIERVGACGRFLPLYGSDFHPIERGFAKLTAFLRAARPRSFDQVVELVAIALQLFTPRECLNFVPHCGYRVTTTL